MEKCKKILKAVDETKGSVQGQLPVSPHSEGTQLIIAVLFNYRYNPCHWKIEEVISSGKIGNVKSVHFEWLLVSWRDHCVGTQS